MAVSIRDLTEADADAVLAINQASVEMLWPMDLDEYRWFLTVCSAAWAAEVDGNVVGFVLLLEPGVDYDSRNYAWFSARYDAFLYLDRVAVDTSIQRAGVGTAIYDAVDAYAAERNVPVLLEVNLNPPNPTSLAFHLHRGYEPLADLTHDEHKTVRYFERRP